MHALLSDTPSQPHESSLRVPDVVPIFPLPSTVLLPGEVLPLHIFEPRYRDMVRDALASHRVIGMVSVLPGHELEHLARPPVNEVGCVGLIAQHQELPDGRFLLWLLGLERFRIDEELTVDTRYRQVRVTYQPAPDTSVQLAGMEPVRAELRRVLPTLLEVEEPALSQLGAHLREVGDEQLLALAAHILELQPHRKQELLEAPTQTDRYLMVYQDVLTHLEAHPELTDDGPGMLH